MPEVELSAKSGPRVSWEVGKWLTLLQEASEHGWSPQGVWKDSLLEEDFYASELGRESELEDDHAKALASALHDSLPDIHDKLINEKTHKTIEVLEAGGVCLINAKGQAP